MKIKLQCNYARITETEKVNSFFLVLYGKSERQAYLCFSIDTCKNLSSYFTQNCKREIVNSDTIGNAGCFSLHTLYVRWEINCIFLLFTYVLTSFAIMEQMIIVLNMIWNTSTFYSKLIHIFCFNFNIPTETWHVTNIKVKCRILFNEMDYFNCVSWFSLSWWSNCSNPRMCIKPQNFHLTIWFVHLLENWCDRQRHDKRS